MIQELTNLLSYRTWLLEKSLAERAPIIYDAMISGKMTLPAYRIDSREREKKEAVRYNGIEARQIGSYVSTRAVKSKSGQQVAIISVLGALTKRGELCSYGMRDYSNELAALNENEDIAAIVLDIESPGGTVDGTNEFGLAIKNSKKPIVAFGDGTVASAAYWVASQARWIVGNKNNPTEFGSIGTLYIHENWSTYIEENIGQVKIIRASQSKDKARVNSIEQLTEDQEAEIVADLTAITKDFISTVKKGRGDRLNPEAEIFTGKMFKNSDALAHGMIDSIGSIHDAINKAAELVSSPTTKSKSSNRQMKFNKIAANFLGKKTTKVNAEQAAPAQEEPTAAESQGVAWSEELVFNTDGSGDGASCNHPDSEGNIRNFDTKTDNNEGNEPPTDPAITENDNWVLAAEASEEEETETEESESAKAHAQVTSLSTRVAKLEAEAKKKDTVISSLKRQLTDAKAKLENKPAAEATIVAGKNDKGHEYAGKQPTHSWEKKAAKRIGLKTEE
jgi:protease-4